MDVVFLSPTYPPEMRQYTRGLAEVGARVYGVGDAHPSALGDTNRYLSGYLQVPKIMHEEDVIERVSGWLRGKHIDRVLTNWEPLIELAATMRERWGVPGMSLDVARGFRDKKLMKDRVRAAGLRVPLAERARTANEVRAAAEKIGFPLVIKPIAGAGSADTYRCDDKRELEAAIVRMGHVEEAACEEYIDGSEFTFDTVCIQGRPMMENICSYLPKPLVARHNEWISPVVITVRDMAQPAMAPGVALGRSVLKALGMEDGFTHMEWFLTPRGEAVFGEIGCRPGGANIVDQINYTIDGDMFREWARAVCWHAFEASTHRKYNTAIIFKRAVGEGRIAKITGMGDFKRRFGQWIVEDRLQPIGAPRRNWRQTLISDGYIILRHPEWHEAQKMAFSAAADVTLYAA